MGLSLDPLDVREFLKGMLSYEVTSQTVEPQGSLGKVLTLQKSPRFSSEKASPWNLLRKAIILVALAIGDRVSELAAMS